MTDLDTTGALVSDPQHVQLHDSGWVRLPSGVEVAILWDSQHQLFARLGWAAADAWATAHGFRLPTASTIRELHATGAHVEPFPLPTPEMCASEGVPYDWQNQEYDWYRNGAMRSHQWCAIHDAEALRRCELAGVRPVRCNSKHQYDAHRGIYGGMREDGSAIQPPYTGHVDTWTSYMLTSIVERDATSTPPSGDGDTEPAPESSEPMPPDEWRMLRRGMKGRDVEAWQAVLFEDHGAGLWVDGDFGPTTEKATKRWQAERHLVPDGVVGPVTRSAIGTPPVPVPEEDEPLIVVPSSELLPDPMLMLQAKNYTRGHVARDWFVIHSTEGGVSIWAPLGIARWCAGQDWAGRPTKPPRASWTYVTGEHPDPRHGVIQCVDEKDSAWTAGRKPVNDRALQVEMNGGAASSDWFGPGMALTVGRTAELWARADAKWDLPIREVSTEALRHARRLIEADPHCVLPYECRGGISHWDVTEVWEVAGGHVDPGMRDDRRWDWDAFTEMAQAAAMRIGRRT